MTTELPDDIEQLKQMLAALLAPKRLPLLSLLNTVMHYRSIV